MYPSKKDPVYGTFIQSFVENIRQQNQDGYIKIISIKGRSSNFFIKLWKYAKFYSYIFANLTLVKYDIVYVHTITYPIPPIYLVSIFRRLPLVFNVHGGDVLTRGKTSQILKKLATPLVTSAKMIVSPSHYFKRIVLREFPNIKTEQIFVSPSSGIDESFFINKTKQPNNIFTIGYVSRIDEGKGWDTLIRATEILYHNNLKIKVIFAGKGYKEKKLNEMIKNLALDNIIEYIGPISHNLLPTFYQKLDLFVFPTCLEESLGLVGLEAMASETPVIGSKIGGLTDYIQDGYNGLFFQAGNACDLSQKISYYINLPLAEKIKMGKHAKEVAMQYRSTEVRYKLYEMLEKIKKEYISKISNTKNNGKVK